MIDVSSFTPFTWFHTILSLIALVSGLVVVLGLLGGRTLAGWTALFLVTAVLTSATGFGFPFQTFGPSHWVGVIALVVLAVAIPAHYVFHYAGAWRWIYAVGAVITLYFLVFVTIAQVFMKIPSLRPLAPTLSEPAFQYAQGAALLLFVVLAIVAAIRFRPSVT